MKYRLFMAWILLSALLGGCASEPVLVGDRGSRLEWHPRYHTVEPGDTLYSIAWTYGQDYRLIAQWNGLSPPYTIYPGRRIRIAPPPDFAKWRGRGKGSANGTKTVEAPAAPPPQAKAYPRQRREMPPPVGRPLSVPAPESPARPAAGGASPIEWQWPVSGRPKLITNGSGQLRSGIDIKGRRGQPVYAAAAGKVVYSGSGLIGYGKLIILKHDNHYLSAYAHNWELLVKEGEQVAKGAQIAKMGSSSADQVMLHFEIRRNGKPVDPLRYLPKY